MVDNILIIYGVNDTNELAQLGMHAAEEFSNADRVILISKSGASIQVKYNKGESITKIRYIDAEKIREKLGASSV